MPAPSAIITKQQKFSCPGHAKPVYAPYIEHVPPDVTAGIFWLKNRDPGHWRDVQNVTHVLGKYIISDKPMTEAEWAAERATIMIDEKAVELPAASLALPTNGSGQRKPR
jgi:hypothetical protein